MNLFLQLVLCFAPRRLKIFGLRRGLGWGIHPTARIGLSIFIRVGDVNIGADVRIGHFNVFRNLKSVTIDSHSAFGQWNWITAAEEAGSAGECSTLRVGADAAVTSRHYLDCSGGLTIGHHTTLAGTRTTVITHQIDVEASRQTSRAVVIGNYCLIASNVAIAPGAHIPDRCLIAMGATVVGRLEQPGMLYTGTPARPRRKVADGEYFSRQHGIVTF